MPDTPDIALFRAKLVEARDELRALQGTRDASSATVVLDQTTVGRLSRMDALQQQAMAKSTRQRAAAALGRIDAALRRCDDGSYGLCRECEEPIDPRRLEFDPASALCLACASAREG